MSWERDFEGIPVEGKHTVYSFLFCVDETNHTYETICDKELTAKRRYGRYLKKFGDTKLAELISFWMCWLFRLQFVQLQVIASSSCDL